MVSKGQVAQKGTKHIKLAFSQTILDPSGVVAEGIVFVEGKVVDVGVVGGVGSDPPSDPVPAVCKEVRVSFMPDAVGDNESADPSAFAFLSASVSVLT